ncbi:hypothetical protein SAMN03159444_01720 [Pseudomonas sp. NFACC02]|nr:hypothetical protein SAMN03159444_01720 [Pseudomonas sp. NFACC02]
MANIGPASLRPSDAKAIARVHISSWQAAYRDLMPAEYLQSLGASLHQRESNVFVAEVNNEVVGWMSVGANQLKGMLTECLRHIA